MRKDERDPLVDKAIEVVRNEGKVSIALIRESLSVNHVRAMRLVDALEYRGVVKRISPNKRVVIPQ